MNTKRIGAHLVQTLLAATVIMSANVQADWTDWTGGFEGGQVLTGDDKGTRLRFAASNSNRPFNQAFYVDWLRGADSGNSYEVGYTPRYWFTDKVYGFGEGSLRTSKSFQISQQIRVLVGAGTQLVNTDTRSLYLEAGVGQVTTKYDYDENDIGLDPKVSSGIGTVRLGAFQILSDLIKLEVSADYSVASELVQTTAEAGISLKIPGGAIKYSNRYSSSKVGDAEATDASGSSVSFNYGF